MQVIVDGLLTEYLVSGKGKTVVLLHGWGDRAVGLKTIQAELAKTFQVIALDLPGFGKTTAPKTAWGLTDYATFVAHFLEKIDAGKVYALLGHSNGGGIAIRGLSQYILSADKLVLLASAGIRGTYNTRNKALRLVVKAGKLLTFPLPKSFKKQLRRKVYATVGSDMLAAERLQDTFKKIVADDVQQDATALQQPTLLVYGEDDLQTPIQYGELFHELIGGSTLEVLPGAGHFVYLDRPEATMKAIKEFLK